MNSSSEEGVKILQTVSEAFILACKEAELYANGLVRVRPELDEQVPGGEGKAWTLVFRAAAETFSLCARATVSISETLATAAHVRLGFQLLARKNPGDSGQRLAQRAVYAELADSLGFRGVRDAEEGIGTLAVWIALARFAPTMVSSSSEFVLMQLLLVDLEELSVQLAAVQRQPAGLAGVYRDRAELGRAAAR